MEFSGAWRGSVRECGEKIWPKFQRHERGWDLLGSSPKENKIILEGDPQNGPSYPPY